jgi:hypothetical protein
MSGVTILWVVWVLPDMKGHCSIKCIFPIEQAPHAPRCVLGLMWTVCYKLLRQSYETAFVSCRVYDGNEPDLLRHAVLGSR